MKRKIQVVIAAIMLISSFSACDDTIELNDDSHSLVNYTDTGDVASSLSSRTAEIDHEIPSSEPSYSSVINESSKYAENRTVSQNMPSKTNSNKTQSFFSSNNDTSENVRGSESIENNTVSIITYYYENEEVPVNSEVVSENENNEAPAIDTECDTDTEFCSDCDNTSSIHEQMEEPIAVGSFSENDIAFSYNSEKIHLGDNIKNAVEIIGEPIEVDSNSYNYENFWILIKQGENEEEEFVEEIQIFSNTLETEKGIKIGMTGEDVIRTYGNSSAVVNDEYRYYIGNKYMYFYISNGTVANMGYRIDREVDAEAE